MNGQEVLDLVLAQEPALGPNRLLCIDGPAGSGKSTLATEVAALGDASVVRMDDLYPGWSGIFAVETTVLALLEPLSHGSAGTYHRYDWQRHEYAEEHTVEPAPLLVLEGVGSGRRSWAGWTSGLVWIETDDETRLARGLARDGKEFRAQWLAWMLDEQRLFAAERTRERADLVIRT